MVKVTRRCLIRGDMPWTTLDLNSAGVFVTNPRTIERPVRLRTNTFSAHVWHLQPALDGEYLRLTASSNTPPRVWLKIHMSSPVTVFQKHAVGYQYECLEVQFRCCHWSPAGQPKEFSGHEFRRGMLRVSAEQVSHTSSQHSFPHGSLKLSSKTPSHPLRPIECLLIVAFSYSLAHFRDCGSVSNEASIVWHEEPDARFFMVPKL